MRFFRKFIGFATNKLSRNIFIIQCGITKYETTPLAIIHFV